MNPTTAHLRGGPKDGQSLALNFLGKQLRYTGDEEDGGRYVFAGTKLPDDVIYRWQEDETS